MPAPAREPAPPAPPPARAPTPRVTPAAVGFRGRVSGFQTRRVTRRQTYFIGAPPGQPQVPQTRRIRLTVWTFRLEPAEDGALQGPIVVEMTGRRFDGTLADGNEVQIDREPPRSGRKLKIKTLQNRTTGETVRAKGGPLIGRARVVAVVIQLVVLVAIIVVVLTVVIPHFKHSP